MTHIDIDAELNRIVGRRNIYRDITDQINDQEKYLKSRDTFERLHEEWRTGVKKPKSLYQICQDLKYGVE